jgi:putative ATPase
MAPTLFDPPPGVPPTGDSATPLADRMRPRRLSEVAGHESLVGAKSFLARAVAEDRLPSVIFWGPPGCGKTTLARILADETAAHFVPFSAVTSGVKEVKQVMADASRLRRGAGSRTLVFIDEIHRFNKAQQDAFLPYVESGDIVLIGATTENPSFELNAALLSRCRVVALESLAAEAVLTILTRALADSERGLGGLGVSFTDDGLATITQLASGDARRALNLLEQAAVDAVGSAEGEIGAERVAQIAQRKVLLYDKTGEEHFNLISALHKSLRESDPDAALYWLARMLTAGEDPNYLARRMVRFASEDIGLAAPQALTQSLAAWDAYRRLGSPEGELALAQCCLYLALAPKSNSVYRAYGAVRRAIAERPAEAVPKALRNAPTRLMRDLDYGRDYVYAHDTESGVGGLECLPEGLAGTRFYEPGERGFEVELGERLERFRALRREGADR